MLLLLFRVDADLELDDDIAGVGQGLFKGFDLIDEDLGVLVMLGDVAVLVVVVQRIPAAVVNIEGLVVGDRLQVLGEEGFQKLILSGRSSPDEVGIAGIQAQKEFIGDTPLAGGIGPFQDDHDRDAAIPEAALKIGQMLRQDVLFRDFQDLVDLGGEFRLDLLLRCHGKDIQAVLRLLIPALFGRLFFQEHLGPEAVIAGGVYGIRFTAPAVRRLRPVYVRDIGKAFRRELRICQAVDRTPGPFVARLPGFVPAGFTV